MNLSCHVLKYPPNPRPIILPPILWLGECCGPQCRHQPRTNNRALSSTMSGPPIRSIPDLTYYTADFYMVLMDQEDVKM